MSTLEIHAPRTSKLRRRFGNFARLTGLLAEVLDVFAEAQRMAHEAERRYHFTSS
jgi:hypothetical protein